MSTFLPPSLSSLTLFLTRRLSPSLCPPLFLPPSPLSHSSLLVASALPLSLPPLSQTRAASLTPSLSRSDLSPSLTLSLSRPPTLSLVVSLTHRPPPSVLFYLCLSLMLWLSHLYIRSLSHTVTCSLTQLVRCVSLCLSLFHLTRCLVSQSDSLNLLLHLLSGLSMTRSSFSLSHSSSLCHSLESFSLRLSHSFVSLSHLLSLSLTRCLSHSSSLSLTSSSLSLILSHTRACFLSHTPCLSRFTSRTLVLPSLTRSAPLLLTCVVCFCLL